MGASARQCAEGGLLVALLSSPRDNSFSTKEHSLWWVLFFCATSGFLPSPSGYCEAVSEWGHRLGNAPKADCSSCSSVLQELRLRPPPVAGEGSRLAGAAVEDFTFGKSSGTANVSFSKFELCATSGFLPSPSGYCESSERVGASARQCAEGECYVGLVDLSPMW